MRQKKSSNNHGNIIPISIVSFHYHFLFHSCSGRKQKESLSQFQIAVDVKQFCFLSHIYNAEKKPYLIISCFPTPSYSLRTFKNAFTILSSFWGVCLCIDGTIDDDINFHRAHAVIHILTHSEIHILTYCSS